MTKRLVMAWIVGWMALGTLAQGGLIRTAAAAEVSGFRVWTDPDKTRAVLDLSGRAEYRLFTLKNPDRVVIDLNGSELQHSLDFQQEHAGIITGVRHGAPDEGTLRVVFDLSEAGKLKSFMLDPTGQYGHRLVIDLYPETGEARAVPVRQYADMRNSERDVVVAIDAGHGGEDPGALGPRRTREKDVVLAIAKELSKAIDNLPGMRAVLIRDGDYYIPHRDRYEKARQHRADLFVSIHADAFHNPRVAGGSVFILSNRGASSEFARRLADSENRSDLIGGVTLKDKDDMLASVLLDLSQSATLEASSLVAQSVFSSMREVGKTHKNRVEAANFLVLKSPDVPSILVETAFISNPAEEARLKDPKWQRKMAGAIARGVQDYFVFSPPPGTWIAANRKPVRYRVMAGDTLGGIADRYRVTVYSLRQANGLKGDIIRVGTELLIPTT
ncbi:N-acetylmuramoyl-L-alanine amidase [Elongatibacter sediminis]|uniref:N-acetylmuramoyl-L-alanine amidase AmiC n=1 Tax=Elongatibacter sediminis TaxID=3119006 RepID=A0AAW9R6G7_9GAMM